MLASDDAKLNQLPTALPKGSEQGTKIETMEADVASRASLGQATPEEVTTGGL
jgi:hypothetical protein